MTKETRTSPMVLMNENQLQVVRGYLELLETIDEAFGYVNSQPTIEQVEAAKKMFPEILRGWTRISETHGLLRVYFDEQPSVQHSIERFNELIEEWELKRPFDFFSESASYEQIKILEPSYQKWKQGMESELLKVAVH